MTGLSSLPIGLVDNFFLEVSRGKVQGWSNVIIRGHNPSQSAASGFVDIAEQGDLTYLTTAYTHNIVSTSTDDTGLGDGLQSVLVSGVSQDGSLQSEVVILNGTTNVLTTKEYLRINFLIGLTAGSTGWNVGTITAKETNAATVQCEIDPTESISQGTHYTVPLNYNAYLCKVELNSHKVGGADPVIEFKGLFRSGGAGAAWIQGFDKIFDTAVQNELDVDVIVKTKMPEKTDLRLRADTDQNSTETRIRMYLLLEKVA